MAMRGRLYNWVDGDGRKWYSMAAIGDISEALDVLAQTVGSVLVHAVDRWRAPDPASIGDVLTYQGDTGAPKWLPIAAPPSSVAGALVTFSVTPSISHATWTAIPWNLEEYDTGAYHDNVVNDTRLTIPAGVTSASFTVLVTWASNGTGERIIEVTANAFGVAPAALDTARRGRGAENAPRLVAMALCRNPGGLTLKEIADAFGVSHYSSVSVAASRLKGRLAKDPVLRDLVDGIIGKLHSGQK